MAVIIENMEVPENCDDCPMYNNESECILQDEDTNAFYFDDYDALRRGCPLKKTTHCKNCKHWGTGVAGETESVKCCEYANYMVGANGYCTYGEVK